MIDLNFPNAVSDERDFFGRADALAHIEDALLSASRRPVIILGERRIGKTSLQNVSVRRLAPRSPRPVIRLSLPPVSYLYSLDEFAIEILQAVCGELGRKMSDTGLIDSSGRFQFQSYGRFMRALAALTDGAPDALYVLCIDEMDTVFTGRSPALPVEETERILGLINYLAEDRSGPPLALNLTMTRIPESLRQSYSPLSVLQNAEIVEIGPLAHNEADQMVETLLGTGQVLPAGLQRMTELSGGHPYLHKLLMDYLLRGGTPPPIDLPQVNAAAAQALEDARLRPVMENLIRMNFSPAEQKLLFLLAERRRPVNTAELESLGPDFQPAARRLARAGYFTWSRDSGCAWRIQFMCDWLRAWEYYDQELERLDLNGLIDDLESDLVIDEVHHRVFLQGRELDLSPQEYQVLALLCRAGGALVTRDEVADELWPKSAGAVNNTAIDATISRLRSKLGDTPRESRYIVTRPGEGFILKNCRLALKD